MDREYLNSRAPSSWTEYMLLVFSTTNIALSWDDVDIN